MSEKKMREVTRQIQGLKASYAMDLLRFIPRKSARLVGKKLKRAIAHAENNHNLSSELLVVKTAVAEQGPMFKRFRAAARGSAHPIKKATSHIRIILSD